MSPIPQATESSASAQNAHAYLERYPNLDPITFQVINNGTVSLCREMGIAMVRTAYSPIFVEGHDFSCALLDAAGDMAASWAFASIHLSAMPYAARWSVTEFGLENLQDGDVIIHNDPFRGGSHLPDITVVKPVFVDGQLISMAVNRAHHLDVGGKARGGMPGNTTDVHQEGIVIPPVRWYRAGEEQTDVLDFLLANVRLPHLQVGDFRAMLASCVTAERRVVEFCERYGTEPFVESLSASQDYAEQRMRAAIAAMPDGVYAYEDYMEDDGCSEGAYKIKATVTIADSELTLDLTGTSREAEGPINMPWAVTSSATFNTLLQVADPDIPFNAGCYRPVKIVAPRGTIVNAQYPAPVAGGNTDTSQRLLDVLNGALLQAVPDRVIANGWGSALNVTGGGYDEIRDEWTAFYFFPEGGWGGRPWGDGFTATTSINGNNMDIPVEICEARYPVRYESIVLNENGEGAGRNRGGFGIVRTLKLLNERMELNCVSDRQRIGPSGIMGGDPSDTNKVLLRRSGESEFRRFTDLFDILSPSKFANIRVYRDDAIRIVSAGGGGYGSPLEREPERVLEDVSEELVSVARAREKYGVVIAERDGKHAIDAEATERLRDEMRERRAADETERTLVDGRITPSPGRRLVEVGGVVDPPPADDRRQIQLRIDRAAEGIDRAICVNACPKAGDPRRCPLHSAESRSYWGIEALSGWLHRHCVQAPRL